MDTWEILNGVYRRLYQRSHDLQARLASAGYSCMWNWYNYHFSRRDGAYQPEFFPIPVITVENLCDIGLELDSVFIEAHLRYEQALAFDWRAVPWPLEVYGVEDCTEDLYRQGMSLEALLRRIEQCGGEIALEVSLPGDCPDEDILAVAAACRAWDTHIVS